MATEPESRRQRETPGSSRRPTGPLAVVLSGAAARGAFQAGALAELLPALEREGDAPAVILGTSAGSINAVLWGAHAHLAADEAAASIVGIWEQMGHSAVFEPILSSWAEASARFTMGAMTGRGAGPSAMLDTAPLVRTASELLDTDQLSVNIAAGTPAAVGVVATRLPAAESEVVGASGRSVMFLQGDPPLVYHADPENGHDVVRIRLGVDHVVASASIPLAFPAHRIEDPASAAGWYVDGGIRHNAPLLPAIAMGARRVIVISATPTSYSPDPLPADDSPSPPDSHVLGAMLADRVTDDLLLVRRANGTAPLVRIEGERGVMRPNRRLGRIQYQAIAPGPGVLGELAEGAANQLRLGNLSGSIDNLMLRRMIRGAGSTTAGQRELLSYFLFDPDYFAASIEHGRAMAKRAIAEGWLS